MNSDLQLRQPRRWKSVLVLPLDANTKAPRVTRLHLSCRYTFDSDNIHLSTCFFFKYLKNIINTDTKTTKNKYTKMSAVCIFWIYLPFQVQLLHFLVTISYPNKCTGLWLLFRTTISFHLFFFFLPTTAHKIHARRRAKKSVNKREVGREKLNSRSYFIF